MYDPEDERGVPVSTGVPTIVRVSAIVGFIAIIAMISMVIYASAYGHVWPWTQATQVKLT